MHVAVNLATFSIRYTRMEQWGHDSAALRSVGEREMKSYRRQLLRLPDC